jgi:nicotinate-nucleotide adenylyltransferase
VDETDAAGLALLEPPAWTILSHPLSDLSSTALRETVVKSG